ncbi:MAG: phage major capsid protein, partial [Sciscionella sp.]
MSRLQKLIDERMSTWHRMQEIRTATETEDRDFSAEERTNWDAAEKRLTEVGQDIERIERGDALDKVDYKQVVEAREVAPAKEVDKEARYEEAFSNMLRRGVGRLSSSDQDLLRARFEERGTGAQSTSPSAGGYTIPPGFLVRMTEAMKAYGGILGQAEVLNTDSGNP